MRLLEAKMNITTFYLKLYYIFGIIFVFLSDFLEEIPGIECFESIIIILGSLFLLVRNTNNIILTFIFGTLLFCNYSICFPNYIVFNSNTMFTSLSDTSVGYVGLQIILLFVSILGFFFCTKRNNQRIKNLFNLNVRQNVNFYFFHAGMLVLLLGILVFAYTRPEISGERGSPSTIYEYSIILIIVGMYYSAKNKLVQCEYIALVALYAAQNFLFGGRITGLQLIFALVIFFFCGKTISVKFVSLGIILYITMIMIGEFRGQILLSSSASIMNGIQNIMMKGFALDTAYSSYFTSLQFVLTADFTSTEQRLYMGLLQFISYIIGGTMLPEANIAKYVSHYFVNYMGGVLPFFGYFCFSWIGIVLYALIVCGYVNSFVKLAGKGFNESNHGLLVCVSIYLAATVFRWYLYSPNNLIRGVFILSIVYFISKKILCFRKYDRRFLGIKLSN